MFVESEEKYKIVTWLPREPIDESLTMEIACHVDLLTPESFNPSGTYQCITSTAINFSLCSTQAVMFYVTL
jgi:hypothetical protein